VLLREVRRFRVPRDNLDFDRIEDRFARNDNLLPSVLNRCTMAGTGLMSLIADGTGDLMNQEAKKKKLMLVCSRDTLDGAYPSAVLAINAVRLGMDASIYYTFNGLNVIRKGFAEKLKFYPSGPLGAIPGMAQLVTGIMKKKLEKAEMPSLEDLLEMCQLEGVKLIGCHMAMTIFELDSQDFLEGVEIANAADFLKMAQKADITLFT